MADEKTTRIPDSEFDTQIDAAVKMEAEAQQGDDVTTYTHKFKTPFTYEGQTYTELTFDFSTLTGQDSQAVENEMLARGRTMAVPEFDGGYLCGMAARACTYRTADGRQTVSGKTISAMPVRAYRKIIGRMRTFLLRAE